MPMPERGRRGGGREGGRALRHAAKCWAVQLLNGHVLCMSMKSSTTTPVQEQWHSLHQQQGAEVQQGVVVVVLVLPLVPLLLVLLLPLLEVTASPPPTHTR